jgi:hypothetical protein
MPCSLAWNPREELVCEAKAAKCPEAAEIFLSVGVKGNGGNGGRDIGANGGPRLAGRGMLRAPVGSVSVG